MKQPFVVRVALVISVILYSSVGVQVAAQESSAKPKAQQNDEFEIQYDDLDLLLSGSVIDVGMSDRRPASRKGARTTSSKMRHGNTSATGFEGNRVAFSDFKQEHVDYLLAIRQDLEAVPNFMPLKSFSANEQLAYWLNLHNVAVMLEVAKAYPTKKVKSLVVGRKSVWDTKTMKVGSKEMSIQDIEDYVIGRWNDPLVLYGFFMGAVGGPNIRVNAYTGDNVAESLQANAIEFVNSLRGFKMWSGSGRVSDHYKLGERYFPNFEQDIKRHLLTYARPDTRRDLERAKSFKIKNYDWGIADLKNGDTFNGGSFNTSSGTLGFFITGTPTAIAGSPPPSITRSSPTDSIFNTRAFDKTGMSKISPQTRALLRGIKLREERRRREGTVTIEEFVDNDGGRITRKRKEDEISVSPSEDKEKLLT